MLTQCLVKIMFGLGAGGVHNITGSLEGIRGRLSVKIWNFLGGWVLGLSGGIYMDVSSGSTESNISSYQL